MTEYTCINCAWKGLINDLMYLDCSIPDGIKWKEYFCPECGKQNFERLTYDYEIPLKNFDGCLFCTVGIN